MCRSLARRTDARWPPCCAVASHWSAVWARRKPRGIVLRKWSEDITVPSPERMIQAIRHLGSGSEMSRCGIRQFVDRWMAWSLGLPGCRSWQMSGAVVPGIPVHPCPHRISAERFDHHGHRSPHHRFLRLASRHRGFDHPSNTVTKRLSTTR